MSLELGQKGLYVWYIMKEVAFFERKIAVGWLEVQHARAVANHWTCTGKALGNVLTHVVFCVCLMIGQTEA